MAKVPLRLYNREIENLIENGQVEEAVAHCIYILHSYPKHIVTYRLLGKALLESQKYEEASDIFQRVLVALPDDFVSQVGMSIIRENEGDFDNAIWHMERAFEVQPSNNVVQDELRRLYERRDGVKLSRIRLTRGALARMYAKGDLYQQAIAELRAILANEPNRPDLQVLLARMCFQVGQRIETTELCSELLGKYPYCFEANRLLAQILPNTSRSDDTKIYLQRLSALDPYIAFQNLNMGNSKDVSENSVMLDRYEYQPSIAFGTEKQEILESTSVSNNRGQLGGAPLPDWLKGFEKSSASIETPKTLPQAKSTTVSDQGREVLFSDWIKTAELEPENEGATDVSPTTSGQANDLVTGVKKLTPSSIELPPSSTEVLPDWLRAFEVPTPEIHKPENEPSDDTSEEISPLPSAELPDWLQQLKTQAPASTDDESLEDTESVRVSSADQLPTISRSLDEVPDWIKELETESNREIQPVPEQSTIEPSNQISEKTSEVSVHPDVEIPEWLQELGTKPSPIPQLPEESLQGQLLREDVSRVQPIPEEMVGAEVVPEIISQTESVSQEVVQFQPTSEEIGNLSPFAEESITTQGVSEEDVKSQLITEESVPTQPSITEIIQPQPITEAVNPSVPLPVEITKPQPVVEEVESSQPNLEKVTQSQPIIEEVVPTLPINEEKVPRAIETGQVSQQPPSEAIPIEETSEPIPDWLQNIIDTQSSKSTTLIEPMPIYVPGIMESTPITESQPNQNVAPSEEQIYNLPLASGSDKEPSEGVKIIPDIQGILTGSQAAINEGNIEDALKGYNQLVTNGVLIDETIHDLRVLLNSSPTNSPIWQVLGDAYFRSNRLQDALDAYSKAEELIL